MCVCVCVSLGKHPKKRQESGNRLASHKKDRRVEIGCNKTNLGGLLFSNGHNGNA